MSTSFRSKNLNTFLSVESFSSPYFRVDSVVECFEKSKEVNIKIFVTWATRKVFENENILAFSDINPCAEHHYLIIPKEHIKSLNEVQDNHKNILGEILLTASQLASKLGFAEQGYRIVANTNEDGGQTVHHFQDRKSTRLNSSHRT